MQETNRIVFDTEIELGGIRMKYTISYDPACFNTESKITDIRVSFHNTDANHMFFGVPDRERMLALACDAHYNLFHSSEKENEDATYFLHS